ncbi:helix-turn-helix domain-containing protein [Streptomyces aureus]
MCGGRELTTAELCDRIRDVSKATVYRHVDLLAAGGVLEVALERRVRGAVERRYRLRRDRAGINTDTVNSLSLDDHRSAFAAALAVLAAEFTAYLDRDTADPVADLVGYRQHAVWLSPGELRGMINGMRRPSPPPGQQAITRPHAVPDQPDPLPRRSAADRDRRRQHRHRQPEPGTL